VAITARIGSVEVFVVFGEATAAVDPGDGAFDDPAPWDDLETLGLGGGILMRLQRHRFCDASH
jgi:hypothetical protein